MVRRKAVIRSQGLRYFFAAARQRGLPVDALIERHRLPPNLEQSVEAVIPLQALQQIPDEIADLLGAPFLAVQIACTMQRGRFGLLEFLFRNAKTLGHAFQLSVRYGTLMNELTRVSIGEANGELLCTHWIDGEPLCLGQQANEFVMVMVVRLFRQITEQKVRFERIWFAHARREDPAPLIEALGTDRVLFGQGTNGVAVDPSMRDLPIVASDSDLFSVLERHAQETLAKQPSISGGLRSVREQIRRILHERAPRIETVAAALAMSRRTLQRRLAEEDTDFGQVVDAVRSTLCEIYLADPALSLADVAALLGYSEQRAFLRAFKRWTGTTPSRHRATLR